VLNVLNYVAIKSGSISGTKIEKSILMGTMKKLDVKKLT
jgi:hypothetical protein